MAVKVGPDGELGALSVPDDDGSGPLAALWAQFSVSLSGIQDELIKARHHRERALNAVRPIKVTLPAITAAAGTLNLPDICGPRGGYAWDLHIVTLNSALTAGTVAMFSGGGGMQEFVFSSPANQLLQYGKGQMVLMPNDWLTFQATGLTGSAQFCLRATQIDLGLLADYLI